MSGVLTRVVSDTRRQIGEPEDMPFIIHTSLDIIFIRQRSMAHGSVPLAIVNGFGSKTEDDHILGSASSRSMSYSIPGPHVHQNDKVQEHRLAVADADDPHRLSPAVINLIIAGLTPTREPEMVHPFLGIHTATDRSLLGSTRQFLVVR